MGNAVALHLSRSSLTFNFRQENSSSQEFTSPGLGQSLFEPSDPRQCSQLKKAMVSIGMDHKRTDNDKRPKAFINSGMSPWGEFWP